MKKKEKKVNTFGIIKYECIFAVQKNNKQVIDFKEMVSKVTPKKRVVISEENMSDELKEELKARYPLGVSDSMIRINKPNGDFFYGVVLEMPDVTYLVKLKVKVDKSPAEDIDKELFDDTSVDEIKEAEDVIPDEQQADDED